VILKDFYSKKFKKNKERTQKIYFPAFLKDISKNSEKKLLLKKFR